MTSLDTVFLDATLREPATRRVIGNNIGYHLFQCICNHPDLMSTFEMELHDNSATLDRHDKIIPGLQAEFRRLRSAKHSPQAVRSRLFENYQKATSKSNLKTAQPSEVATAWPTAAVSTKIGSCTC